jgi:hypothetical protein
VTQHKLTILVNSSDGFSDCWEPFFKLFTIYWPNCKAKILLNTETADWSFPGLNLHCTKVGVGAGKLTWSECLIRALDQVDTPLVLYFQEDYFLERLVDVSLVHELADMMEADGNVKHIGLTHFGSYGPFLPTSDPRLWKIDQKTRYRISTQAGLWRTETLRSYLKPEENGWMFEIYGTRRCRKREECFLTVNRDIYCPTQTPVFQYTHTGIIKGKWHQDMQQLFMRHGIEVDFEKRGFYKEPHWLIRKVGTLKKLASKPVAFVRGKAGY